MRTLILAAGRFGKDMQTAISTGREPRLDVFELARVLDADVLDYLDVDDSAFKLAAKAGMSGTSAALAALGFGRRKRYDAILTTGEDIGLPLAALLKTSSAPLSHTMIAHTLFPAKKRLFFDVLKVHDRIDRVLAYSTSEERHMIDRLKIPAERVQRIYYHSDQLFFCPVEQPPEPNTLCAAGQLLRDYDCLVDAVRGRPVQVQIAAGSPWIEQTLRPKQDLPPNVKWGRMSRFELRELYRRSALAVVPIKQNDYQTGIATILEMMAMGKCVIASRTRGQTDTIIDGVTGVYVPPGDPAALQSAIERMLANPDEAARIGGAARSFVEREASLDVFVERVAQAVRDAHAARRR